MDTLQAWNSILSLTTPNGNLVSKGSPQRLVAEYAANCIAPSRKMDPVRIPPQSIDPHSLDVLKSFGEDGIANRPEDLLNHRIAKLTKAQEAYVRELAVLEWCQKVHTGIGDYASSVFIYYDKEGEDSKLHVDNAEGWEYNLLICLDRHIPEGSRGSATYFMLGDGETRAYSLMPGQAAVFHSNATPHGRTPVAKGEETLLLSIGLKSRF